MIISPAAPTTQIMLAMAYLACDMVKERSARLTEHGTIPAKEKPNRMVAAHSVGRDSGDEMRRPIPATATTPWISNNCSGVKECTRYTQSKFPHA